MILKYWDVQNAAESLAWKNISVLTLFPALLVLVSYQMAFEVHALTRYKIEDRASFVIYIQCLSLISHSTATFRSRQSVYIKFLGKLVNPWVMLVRNFYGSKLSAAFCTSQYL